MISKFIELPKLIGITILVWVMDIIFWGSGLGLIYMVGHWEFTFIMYAKGVATYFVLNAFMLNWTYWFKMVETEFGGDNK